MSIEDAVQHYRNKGNACFKNKNYTEAISNYNKGLELDATNPNLNNNIAQAYLENCDFVNAEVHAIQAITNRIDSPKGYFRAAKASASLGNIDKAIEYLKDGINKCTESKDLVDYLHTLRQETSYKGVCIQDQEDDISEEIPELVSDSDSDDGPTDKLRSRSTSRMTTNSSNLDSKKEMVVNQRSVSMSRSSSINNTNSKSNKKAKKKKGPLEMESIIKDPFLSTLDSIKKEKGFQQITPEQLWNMKRKELNLILSEGSELMTKGLSRKAVDKYKAALDMILEHSVQDFKLREIDLLVLKYSLCVAWIELANYADIAKAVEYLKDIEDTRASRFPAVFYGLGSAYYKLNRYKAATEHLEKGLLFLSREVKFEIQSWPGTNNIIPETTRPGLEEVLKELLKTCRAYHEPDAICRYSKCLSLSSHIIPSDYIYYSDPDFCGFFVVFCEERCRIEYHVGCWKDFKETSSPGEIGKISDKDFIGRDCPTTDCLNQYNKRSTIVRIEIIGDDTTLKTCIEPPKTDPSVKESKKSKKKKTEKSSDTTSQEKPKTKTRPKVKKNTPETIQTAPQQEVQATNSTEELESRLEKLKVLRDVNFGFADEDNWNPKETYYGRADIQALDSFLSPEFIEDSEAVKAKKEFVFSYFYEFIRNEGPQKQKDVEQKWLNEVGDFEGVREFMKTHISMCSFLLQSYRFATIDDYICLAEQLPETYTMAKTELCESLSFTLTGQPKCTNVLGIDNVKNKTEITNGAVVHDNEKICSLEDNSEVNSQKSEESTNVVEKSDGEALEHNTEKDVSEEKEIPSSVHEQVDDKKVEVVEHNTENHVPVLEQKEVVSPVNVQFDDVEVEDPDIDTSLNNMNQRSHLISISESTVSEEDKSYENDCFKNDEINIEDKKDKIQNQELNSSLVPNVDTFQTIATNNIQEQGTETNIPSVLSHDNASKDTLKISSPKKSIPDTTLPLNSIDNSQNSLKLHNKWSSDDGVTNDYANRLVPVHNFHNIPAVSNLPYAGQYLPIVNSAMRAVTPLPRIPQMEISTQTDNTRNFEEEISNLQTDVSKLKIDLEEEKKTHKNFRTSSQLALEEKDKNIKDLESELTKTKKDMDKNINNLKEKLMKQEEEFKSEKTKLEKEKTELQKSESNTKERMRDLIFETGHKVKELEQERSQFQKLVLQMKKETGELKISVYKQKCLDTLKAMKNREKFLTEFSRPKKTEVILAIQNWEKYLTTLKEFEEQFKAHCSSISNNIGNISSGELTNIEWPELPIGPECPLHTIEELTHRIFEEKQDLEKMVAEGKEMARMNVDQNDLSRTEDEISKLTNLPQTSFHQNRSPENLDEKNKTSFKMEDKFGIANEFKTNTQKLHHLNSMQNGHVKSSFEPKPNPSAGVPLYHQTVAPNQGYRYMSPYYYNSQSPFPVMPMFAPPEVPIIRPQVHQFYGGMYPNDKPGVQLQEIASPPPAAEPKPSSTATSFLTDKKTDNIGSLLLKEATLHAEKEPLNKSLPERKKSPTPVFGLTPIDGARVSPPAALALKTVTNFNSALKSVPHPSLVTIPATSTYDQPPAPATVAKPKGGSSYQKLMAHLHKNFPTKTEEELAAGVAVVREKNNNSLSGLTVPTIISMVDKVLKEKSSKKQGSMGLDKFGGTAWGGVRDSANNWTKPKDNPEGDCPICMEPMDKNQTSLHCKHTFHTECIKKWLRTNSICPNCRVFTKLVDEFPPLS